MTLSKAFTQTQTDEWVVFGLTRSGSQRFTELTGGGGYVDGSLLHIVLANYRKVVTMPSTRHLLGSAPCVPTLALSTIWSRFSRPNGASWIRGSQGLVG